MQNLTMAIELSYKILFWSRRRRKSKSKKGRRRRSSRNMVNVNSHGSTEVTRAMKAYTGPALAGEL